MSTAAIPRRALPALLGLASCLPALPALGQVEAFRYVPARVPVGCVHQYVKSNRDGSHAGRVSVYVAKADRLESLKWDDEVGWATHVVAELDWSRFSVRRFESWKLRQGKAPVLQATLETDASGGISISVIPGPPLHPKLWPWHSYDFDFASLGATLPHLKDPEAPFRIGRSDFVEKDGAVRFEELGAVDVAYSGRETRAGTATRRYVIGGPGLEGTSGTLWADAAAGHLVELELPIPDEPGFTDVRLRLLEVASLSPEAWEAFKRARLGE
jgi:hypothetical protein